LLGPLTKTYRQNAVNSDIRHGGYEEAARPFLARHWASFADNDIGKYDEHSDEKTIAEECRRLGLLVAETPPLSTTHDQPLSGTKNT
jgi:hypothetical protein